MLTTVACFTWRSTLHKLGWMLNMAGDFSHQMKPDVPPRGSGPSSTSVWHHFVQIRGKHHPSWEAEWMHYLEIIMCCRLDCPNSRLVVIPSQDCRAVKTCNFNPRKNHHDVSSTAYHGRDRKKTKAISLTKQRIIFVFCVEARGGGRTQDGSGRNRTKRTAEKERGVEGDASTAGLRD